MLKRKHRFVIITAALVSCALVVLGISGCAKNSVTSMSFSYSDFDDVKTQEISVRADQNNLDMSGNIKISSGTVVVRLRERASGKTLYSKKFTNTDCGNIAIQIENLGKNKDLVLELNGKSAKDFYLHLISE